MIQLTAVQRPNPKDVTAPRKYYASTKSAGEVTLETLSEAISEKCTLTETDVLAVLSALTGEMKSHLMNGKIVRFGSFGSFQLSLNSTGVETLAETSKHQVKSAKVRFRPGQKIQDGLKLIKYNFTSKV
jgi:predicted histone-like DNA-binding protein